MRLRYVGAEPVTFVEAGELEPGAEFTVPDERAEGWLRRPDIEEVPADPDPEPDPAPAKTRRTKTSDAAPAADEEG